MHLALRTKIWSLHDDYDGDDDDNGLRAGRSAAVATWSGMRAATSAVTTALPYPPPPPPTYLNHVCELDRVLREVPT